MATFRVDVGPRRYFVDCSILPRRDVSHVGADSPRYMAPGSRARLSILRVMRDGRDVTHAVDESLQDTLQRSACAMAGVPVAEAIVRQEQRVMDFSLTSASGRGKGGGMRP